MRVRSLVAAGAVAAMAIASLAAPAGARKNQAPLKGEGVGMKIIANIEYAGGTDMEFVTKKGRDYAITGSQPTTDSPGAMRVIDITNPAKPVLKATVPCSVSQMDIQISHDKKTVMLAADAAGGPDSCLAVGKLGFMTVDISNILKPKPIGFAEIARGSHNITAHPKKPYVYNSNSDLGVGPGTSEIQIWSIKNPAKPELVNTVPSVPNAPHDISFNKDGTRAVTAAISHVDIFNTEDPENPRLLFTTQCPGCSITHDAKFTPDGARVIVGDEGGGGGGYPCPGGALYVYRFQDPAMILEGIYEPQELVFARQGQTGLQGCTSHVMDVSDDSTHLAISWYSAGTRYLDISNPTGVTFGPQGAGIKEVGWFMPEGGISWSSKFYKGPYIYSNDRVRGFDVFKITAEG